MTIQEMHSWFNILTDHYNEPYFIDTEIDEFINAGTTEFVNDIIFKEYFPTLGQNEKGPQVLNSAESVIQGSEILQPLIVTDLSASSNAQGLITVDSVNSAITTAVGEPSTLMHILNIVKLEGLEERLVRYVRHNDRPRFNQNVFKKATSRNPIFSFSFNGVSVQPKEIGNFILSVIKSPRKVSFDGNISSDLPSFVHQRLIAYAVSLSGIASRDEVMLQLQQATGNGTNRIQG